MFAELAAAHLAYDYKACMNPKANFEQDPFAVLGVEHPDCGDNPESGADRPLRIIVMSMGKTEVCEQTVAEIFSDTSVEPRDHGAAGCW
jgi:hypothetical protein